MVEASGMRSQKLHIAVAIEETSGEREIEE
jgi:hypothetical protein